MSTFQMSSSSMFPKNSLTLSNLLLLLFLVILSIGLVPSSSALHIAHVGGLNVEIPTNGVGGLEKVVEVLIFEQLRDGHQVTLFCTNDSGKLMDFNGSYGLDERIIKDNFLLVPSGMKSLHIHTRNYSDYVDEIATRDYYKPYLNKFLAHILDYVQISKNEKHPIDVVHFHSMDHLEFDAEILKNEFWNARTITTMHMSLENTRVCEMLEKWPKAQLVSISKNQQKYLSKAVQFKPNFIATVHNAYPENMYTPNEMNVPQPGILTWKPDYLFGTPSEPGTPYLAFIGRFSSDKGVHNAIKIALKAGVELRIAAKETNDEKEYRDKCLKLVPKGDKLIKWIGEVKGDKQKKEFLQNAMAMLFPIEWQEPFGLVMIESMACGTPVIAAHTASVPEIILKGGGLTFPVETKYIPGKKGDEDGETRAIYTDEVIEAAADLVPEAKKLDREGVRKVFLDHFTGPVMLGGYKKIYEKLSAKSPEPNGHDGRGTSPHRGDRVAEKGHKGKPVDGENMALEIIKITISMTMAGGSKQHS